MLPEDEQEHTAAEYRVEDTLKSGWVNERGEINRPEKAHGYRKTEAGGWEK